MSDVLRFGKKLFTWSVVAMTIAWSVGLSTFISAQPVQAAVSAVEDVQAGDLIKLADQTAVYFVNEDMERMYFAFGWLYKTWYSDFAGIKTLAAGTDLDEHFPPASRGAVSVRPGSCELMKSPASPAVYATGFDGVRHKVGSEAAAVALCGASWASHVHDLPDFVISLFPMGGELDGTAPFPGQLVRTSANGPVYLVGSDSKSYAVEGTLPAFLAGDVRTVSQAMFDALVGAGEGTRTVASLTSDVAQMTSEPNGDNNDNTDDTNTSTGDLKVSLAGVSPESDIVPGGAQNVPYLAVALEAMNGDVDVESLTFNLGGIGDEGDFSKVYLYHNGIRLDNGRSVNSDGEVTFNFSLTVDSGDTEIVWVKADMNTLASANDGDQNRFELRAAADVDASGDVSGSFPIRGNLMAVGSQDIGTVVITAAGASTAETKIGENEVKVSDFDVEASGDDVHVTSITLEQKGTADIEALSNFVLKSGGATLAEGAVNGDKITFELETADSIDDGDSENYKVYADIGVADVGDKVELVLDEDSDFAAYSEDFSGYDVGVSSSELNTSNALEVTINGGKINVDIDGDNTDVKPDQSRATFGTFSILATAEDIDVDTMDLTLTKTAGTPVLENMKLRDLNGHGTYSLSTPSDIDDADTTGTVRLENVVLSKGVAYEFEITADVPNAADDAADYYFTWEAADVDATGVTSDNDVVSDDFSSSVLTGPVMTVQDSALTVRASALADDTVVNGAKNVLVFRGTLEAGDTSDVTVSSMSFGSSTHSAVWDNRIDGLKLYVVGANVTVDPTKDTPTDTDNSVTSEEAVFDGLDVIVKKGSVNRMKFELYADITDGSTTGTVDVQLEAIEAQDVDGDDVDAEKSDATLLSAGALTTDRDITIAAGGSLTMAIDTDFAGLRNATYALAGTDKALVARIKLQASQEDVMVKDLAVFVSSSAAVLAADVANSIDSLSVYSNSNLSDASLLATTDFSAASTTIEGVDYSVKDGVTSYLYLAAKVNSVGTAEDGTAAPTSSFHMKLGAAATQDVEGVSSRDDITPGLTLSVSSTEVAVASVKLTSVVSTFDTSSSTLSGGDQKIFSFSVTSDSGVNTDSNGNSLGAILTQMDLELSTNVAATPTAMTLCRVDTNECIDLDVEDGDLVTSGTVDLETGADTYVDFTDFANSANVIDDGETVNFVLRATMAPEDNDYVQVRINGIDANGGLQYGVDSDDDGSADYTYSDARLDTRSGDYPDVIGGSLNNN